MKTPIVIEDIIKMLPHRYPFLLIDRVIELTDESVTAIKCVTMNEPHFMGHFPSKPVMPGVLIIEALAQSACILANDFLGEKAHGKLVYFMSIDNAKFRKPVVPGDVLMLKADILSTRSKGERTICKFKAYATVGEDKVAEAVLTAMIDQGA